MRLVGISTGIICRASETEQASELGFGHWDLGVAAMPYGALKVIDAAPFRWRIQSRVEMRSMPYAALKPFASQPTILYAQSSGSEMNALRGTETGGGRLVG